ncbi:MAG: hypothetical protein RL095_3826 [Verrucomicrobiota bacterium]|jgi:glucose/arabinose dehydrogenase
MSLRLLLACLSFALGAAAATPDKVDFEPVYPKLKFTRPVDWVQDRAEPQFAYVVEQEGKIWRVDKSGGDRKELLIDISGRLGHANEEGLLGLCLHPDFSRNRRAFTYETAASPRRSRICEWELKDGKMAGEKLVLEFPQPFANHNGGQVCFGPDGFLYVGSGDGGAGGDPHQNGQNTRTLLGKILRLDVDKPAAGKAYGIPSDNPFASGAEGAPEIFAWGLRNPWRFSFDRDTRQLWVGDVGQNRQEEIVIVRKGDNCGWNRREGELSFPEGKADGNQDFRNPIFVYGRKEGVSVTGGFVYRGKSHPALQGCYVCADFAMPNLWLLREKDDKLAESKRIKTESLNIASFAEDLDGEIYILSYSRNNVFRLKAR